MPLEQMRTTCNMGIGMLFIVAEEDVARVIELLEETGERPLPIGLVETGSTQIRYI